MCFIYRQRLLVLIVASNFVTFSGHTTYFSHDVLINKNTI